MSNETRVIRQFRFAPPPGACEILLVRHGESQPHREGESFPLVGGHGDPPLADEGHQQAAQVADRLVGTGEKVAAIYVTTLTRTHQTAAPLAARLGLEPRVEADLREVYLGEWEGGELRKRVLDGDPIARQMYVEGRWDVIPGSEPGDVFRDRVRAGIERIATAHPDELVVAVVHGGVVGQAMGIAAGVGPMVFSGCDNASITHLVITPERWVVRCYNDTAHLSPTFSTAHLPRPAEGVLPISHSA